MDYEKIKEFRNNTTGFVRLLGIEITEITDGYAKLEMAMKPEYMNPAGLIHGGVIFTLADSAAGSAAYTKGSIAATVSSDINYLRPVIGSTKLTAVGKVLKAGKNLLTVDVEVFDDTDQLVAVSRMTYCSLHREIPI